MARRRYKRWTPLPPSLHRRERRRDRKLFLTIAALLIAVVAALAAVGWRFWLSPSGSAAPLEACTGPECQVSASVAVDGEPLLEPLSFVAQADSAVEIDFVFGDLPMAPEVLRLVTPADQRWLVAEGTLKHPEAWTDGAGEGPAWVAGWDRAGNGKGLLRRSWRDETATPGVYTLEAPRAVQSPAGGFVSGSDALITVPADAPPGNYPITIEAANYAANRPMAASVRVVVSVLDQGPTVAPPEAAAPLSGRRLYSGLCSGCHGNTPNQALRAVLSTDGVSMPDDRTHTRLELEPEQRGQLVGYLLSSATSQPGRALLIPHGAAAQPCLDCHGAGSSAPITEGHPLNVTGCQNCHEQGPKELAGPLIPHDSNLGKPCTECHSPSGRLPLTDTHLRRGEGTCTVCHASSGVTAPSLPHPSLKSWGCLACHDAGASNPMPTAHRRTADWICLVCHNPPPEPP